MLFINYSLPLYNYFCLMLRIKDLLKEKGVTAKELAERIGISQPAMSFAINGNPTVETLEKIAKALGVTIPDLFDTSYHSEPSKVIPEMEIKPTGDLSDMTIDIRSAAKKYGVKMGELAERMAVTRQTIHYYCEQGDKNSISQLKKIAEAIGCDISEFWTSDDCSDRNRDFVAMVSVGEKTRRFDSAEDLAEYIRPMIEG